MNHNQKPPQVRIQNPAYRRAFERLDAALEKNTEHNNTRIIRELRRKLFGNLDKYIASGKAELPPRPKWGAVASSVN